jgi:hypothetical protein
MPQHLTDDRATQQPSRRLLDTVVERHPMVTDGKSGALLERVRLADGRTLVVKHVDGGRDWIMQATGDPGRVGRLWSGGVFAVVPGVIDHGMTQWPTARLDPVRRLLVLARVLPAVGVVERVLDVPYQRVWSFIEDLEHSVPAFDPTVGSLRILSREGERLTVSAVTAGMPFRRRFEVELRDGRCLMRSRLYLVGMAAAPLGERTRYVHLEGLPYRYRGARPLRVLRPLLRRVAAADVDGIAREPARPGGGPA